MSVMTQHILATALMQRLLSNARDVIGKSKQMLTPWGDQEKFRFSFKMRQWWPPQHKGGVRKSVFTCQNLSVSCYKEA